MLALWILSALAEATALGQHEMLSIAARHAHNVLHPSVCHDPEDCTAELQGALNAGGTITLTCTPGQPWITQPLNVTQNNTWLGLGAGCELLAKRGEFQGEFDALLTIRGPSQHKPGDPGKYMVRNISIVGVGGQATLRMHRDDYNNSNLYSHSEHRHGIAIIGGVTGSPAPGESLKEYAGGVFDVRIRDLNITLTGGDGVYISGLAGGFISRVHNTACYRQGSSVIDARNVIYEECSFTGTQGTAPSAGVDIEPNAWTQSFVNLTFRRCNSTNNHGAGFMMCIYHLGASSAPLGVRFEDCHVRNVGLGATTTSSAIPGGGFVLSASSSNESKTTAQGSITWNGGSITDTAEEAIHISRPEPGGVISFSNVLLANNAMNMSCVSSNCFPNFTHRANVKVPVRADGSSSSARGTPNPLFILFNVFDSAGSVTEPSDGLLLSNVLVKDSLRRPFAYVASHSRNVLGTDITVSNTKANGCGKGLVVPFESKAHFAKYGGNVNLTIAHCIVTDGPFDQWERAMLKTDDARLSPSPPMSPPTLPSPGVRIVFEPPFLVDANRSGPSMMDTAIPENFHRLGPQSLSATHIFGPGHSPGPESLDFSQDSGAHWEGGGPSGAGIAIPFPIMAPSGDQCQAMTLNHGNEIRFACDPPDFSSFTDGSGWTQHGYSEFSLTPNGSLQGSNARVRSTWSGIPAPGLNVSSARPAELFGGCSAIVELPGGGWLASVCVTWNGVRSHASPDGLIKPLSIVAFRSQDGLNWFYQSTIANISDFPWSVFGPNEHDLSMLADGKSIVCAIRMDGDAGCSTNTYRYYSQSYSTDLGASWSLPRPIQGAGCARPRLMLMEPHGPLILSGGRLCVENTTGIFLWVNADGLAGLNGGDDKKIWQRHSITEVHNQLWQGAEFYRFGPSINDTNAFASLSYTSLIQTSPTSAAVTYNKFFSPYAWPPWPSANFLLRFSFVADVQGNRVPLLKIDDDSGDGFESDALASQPGVGGYPPNLYCRSGTLGGGVLATANMTVWDAAQQCNNRSLFGGKCAGWTTDHIYPFCCDPNSTTVFQILFKDSASLAKPIARAGWTYFRAIRLPPPPPLPPLPPPSPPPAGVVRLSLQAGMPVDPYYFGWDLEGWTDAMYGTSFPFNDTGGMRLTEALSPGVLRYPGGTGSNIWNMTSGHVIMPPRGYSTYGPIAKYDNALPDGLLGAASYLRGLGGVAKRAVWNLNVYSYTVNETCDEIRMISELPGQQEPGVLLELGNEFYIGGQGRPKFPNPAVYAKYVSPIVACARELMPKALIGAVGCHGDWNQGLRPYLHLFDGITIHNYSPRTRDSWLYTDEGDRFSFYAGYSRASAMADAEQLMIDLAGAKKPIWLTEFQAGLDPPNDCLMPEHIFGALHGSFHAARVIAAINQPGDYAVLNWQTFMSPVDYPRYPNDWCGQAAGLIKSPGFPNRPDLAQVTGPAQLVAHMFSRALEMDTMHPVNISDGPAMQFPIMGQEQPCLQAAGFTGNSSVMIALLNICNTTVPVTLAVPVDDSGVIATEYSFLDKGGKAGLPKQPKQFPWPAPLAAKTTKIRTRLPQAVGHINGGGVLYSAHPFTFAIVEAAPRQNTRDTAQ